MNESFSHLVPRTASQLAFETRKQNKLNKHSNYTTTEEGGKRFGEHLCRWFPKANSVTNFQSANAGSRGSCTANFSLMTQLSTY